MKYIKVFETFENKSESNLTYDKSVNEALLPADVAVVKSFFDKKSLDGRNLNTDGKVLKTAGIGSQEMYTHTPEGVKMVGKISGKYAQSLVQYVNNNYKADLEESVNKSLVNEEYDVSGLSRTELNNVLDYLNSYDISYDFDGREEMLYFDMSELDRKGQEQMKKWGLSESVNEAKNLKNAKQALIDFNSGKLGEDEMVKTVIKSLGFKFDEYSEEEAGMVLGSLIKKGKIPTDNYVLNNVIDVLEESVNEDIKNRFELAYYKDSLNPNDVIKYMARELSHEERIEPDKFSDMISHATKVAKSKEMNAVEFFHRGMLVGSIDKKNGYKFEKGKYYKKSPLSVNEAKYPTNLYVNSIIYGQGFTGLKGIEGGKYYKVVEMDDTTATLVLCDQNGKIIGSKKIRHKLSSIEGGIKTAKRGDENGIVIESVNEIELKKGDIAEARIPNNSTSARMNGVVSTSNINNLFKAVEPLIEELSADGFDLEDIVGFIAKRIEAKFAGVYESKSLNENINKDVKSFLDKSLGRTKAGSPSHLFAVKHTLIGALTDANFHPEAKKVPALFPKAAFEPTAYGENEEDAIKMYEYEVGPQIARIAEYDGGAIVDAIGFYVSMTIGRSVGDKITKLVEGRITEAAGIESINEGSLANYYKNYDAPTRSAAKKVDAVLQNLTKDKKELDNVVDLITDLVDEYATERVDDYQAEKY